jgi:NADP-dependent 3-hydroxy acid dehydrogenase YdfG
MDPWHVRFACQGAELAPLFVAIGRSGMAIALVTGSGSGIGMATAVSFARRGRKVIATMRNLNRATDLRKKS